MAIRLTAQGKSTNFPGRLVARATTRLDQSPIERRDSVFLLRSDDSRNLSKSDISEFAGVVMEGKLEHRVLDFGLTPILHSFGPGGLSHIYEDCVVAINPDNGFIRTVYRPGSPNNSIFATDRCNSNCLMCSQPPKKHDDSYLIDENVRMISLVKDPPPMVGITGGEPTILGAGLIQILEALRDHWPNTHVFMLTNGRFYAYRDFIQDVSAVGHPSLISAVPLYSDVAQEHDYIVQARGAFDQTVEGLLNADEFGLALEIRVVLHLQTIPRLVRLAEFIQRYLPFVSHVALMGLENMGYVRKNWELLWIDPVEYADELEAATLWMHRSGLNVSIYNLPLCLLPKTLWPFARQSISDFKNDFLDVCDDCDVRTRCSGLFTSSLRRHSRSIEPIRLDN